jgi:hypothetical protein
LQACPGDHQLAVALAEVLLLTRASSDPGLEHELQGWWVQAAPIREKTGHVTNTITDGTFRGPVLQGRDFTNTTVITILAPTAPTAIVGGVAHADNGTATVQTGPHGSTFTLAFPPLPSVAEAPPGHQE